MENRTKFKSYYPSPDGAAAGALIAAALFSLLLSCTSSIQRDATPETRLKEARLAIEDRQFETALTTLEELREITAGTRLGGEVIFLMAESKFELGKYAEADSLFESYLAVYPEGPFARQSLFNRGMANLRMVEKNRLGFFAISSFIPHDRDIVPVSKARDMFDLYLEKYPDSQEADSARRMSAELRDKEGLHELHIADFYLRKDRPEAALSRAAAVLEGEFSEEVKSEAADIVRRARSERPSSVPGLEAAPP